MSALRDAIAAEVRAVLDVERPRLVAAIRNALRDESHEAAWWTPSQVRVHARCSSAVVFIALHSGDLPATADDNPARARPGIPSKRWRIRPADARSWAANRKLKSAV